MSDAERYAALRSLYLHWYERTHDEYHFVMACYAQARIAAMDKRTEQALEAMY